MSLFLRSIRAHEKVALHNKTFHFLIDIIYNEDI